MQLLVCNYFIFQFHYYFENIVF